jgi:hypothetical protein
MHNKGAISPDLMLGYAGAGSFLLRFAKAASASDLIFGPLNDAMKTINGNARTAAKGSRAAASIHASAATRSAGSTSDHPPWTTQRKEKTNVRENITQGSQAVGHG